MSDCITTVHTDKAPAAIGPYSQAIAHGGLVYVSGQLGINPETGELVDEHFASQTKQAMENLKAVLKEAGSGLEKVLSVDVFFKDLGEFARFNEIYASYFSEHKPARAAYQVAALPKDGLIEIKCVAKVG